MFKELFGNHIFYGITIEDFTTIIKEKSKKKTGMLAKKYDLERVAKDAIKLYEMILEET